MRDVVLASFDVLSYDRASARWHGVEGARLEKLGKPARFVDGHIASIAHTNDGTLVTANVKDFSRFKGRTVENWAK